MQGEERSRPRWNRKRTAYACADTSTVAVRKTTFLLDKRYALDAAE